MALCIKSRPRARRAISYYKLSHPQAVITPTLIAPLNKVPQAFRKPAKVLEALTYQNNAMVETLPVLDKNNRLKGVVEVKVPSMDIHAYSGAKLPVIPIQSCRSLRFKIVGDYD